MPREGLVLSKNVEMRTFTVHFQPLGHTGKPCVFCYTDPNEKLNERPRCPNRHDLHPERACTAPSEMKGCLPGKQRGRPANDTSWYTAKHRIPPTAKKEVSMKYEKPRNPAWPDWYDGKKINEVQFCVL